LYSPNSPKPQMRCYVSASNRNVFSRFLNVAEKARAKGPASESSREWIGQGPIEKKSHFAWRKSATKFLCVKTVSDKVVRHSLG